MSSPTSYSCSLCNAPAGFWLQKASPAGKVFHVYRCTACGLCQIHPIPSEKELNALYQSEYFAKRTDRGYDNYASDKVRLSYLSTLEKNLIQLRFFEYENTLNGQKTALEVGCAAGYFVGYLQQRGWQATGIDIAGPMIKAAKKNGLRVIEGDFLKEKFKKNSYDLIALWATIEHLREPELFFAKIPQLLKTGGKFYLSTCHTGFFARIYKSKWRYLNVPEHIWYFSQASLRLMGKKHGLTLGHSFTYGSGFTARPESGIFYRLAKKIADNLARHAHTGDMIVCEYIKESV